MKKNFDLWGHSTPPLRKLITELKIALFIIVVSVSNVIAFPANSNLFAITSETELQQGIVSGTVTDASTGEVLTGVNIRVKGATSGAISGVDGKYSLPSAVANNAILVFSFIGYVSQEIPVEGKTVVNVALVNETKNLEEVVVIGYGAQKKETLSGSVASIKAADIMTTKSTSVASAIQGKIPGVMIRQRTAEPGTYNSLISIRGFGTPLLVIDGVVRDGMADFERLNPEDVASISILKDAAAAIYGMNADNGVIIVTTKQGSSGKTKFSFSSLFTTKQPTTTTRQSSVDAYTYRVMRNEQDRNTGSNVGSVQTFSDAVLALWKDGTTSGYQDYNWYKGMLKPFTSQQQHNLSMSGGNDKITFYTSLGYMNDNGLLRGDISKYDKYNFRTNLEAKIAKGLTAKVSISMKYDDQVQTPGSYFWLYKSIITSDRGVGPYTLANSTHFAGVPPENNSPTARSLQSVCGYLRNMNFQYQTTIDLNYDVQFVKGLSLGLLAAYDGNISDNPTLNKAFYVYNYNTDAPNVPNKSTFSESMTNYTREVVQSKIGYKTTIAQAHNLSVTLVQELRSTLSSTVSAKRQYDDVYTHDIISQGSLTNLTNGGTRSQEKYMSYLGRFNYDYKGKYLLEFTFREDGSYRYAPDKRWAFFPGASVGWRVSEESFMKNGVPSISNLKIIASYAKMGRDAGNAFQYYPGYSFGSVKDAGYVFNDGILTLGMIPPGVINNNLSWINTATTDIGLDLDMWKGKGGLTFDLFQKNNNGILATRTAAVPNTFGASFPQENLNSNVIKGVELELRHRNKIGSFDYSVSANVTYSRQWNLHNERAPYQSTWDQWKDNNAGNNRIQNRYWMYTNLGQYQSRADIEVAPLLGGTSGNSRELPGMQIIQDVDGNGIINGNDQLPISWSGMGTNPPLQYGLNLTASWKGIDFSALFQGSALFTIYNSNSDIWGYANGMPTFWSKYMDRWHTTNITDDPWDPATVWIPGKWGALVTSGTGNTSNTVTSIWNLNANYLRIKSVEIGYTIPKRFTRKIYSDKIRVFVNCFNLYTFCNDAVKGMDPERDEGQFSADLTYPLLRSFNFGFNINF